MNNHPFFKGQDKGGKREIETHPKWPIPKGQTVSRFLQMFPVFFFPRKRLQQKDRERGSGDESVGTVFAAYARIPNTHIKASYSSVCL